MAQVRAVEAQIAEAEARAAQQALAKAAGSSGAEVAGLQARLDKSEQAREALQVGGRMLLLMPACLLCARVHVLMWWSRWWGGSSKRCVAL